MAVNVTLTGDGLNYEKEASLVQAARIIGFLNSEVDQTTDSSAAEVSLISTQPNSRQSARERLTEVRARTNPQKILTLGDYISRRDGTETFSISELKPAFSRAGEPVPRNLGRDIKAAIRLGFISEDEGQSDHYYVTNKGQELLQHTFSEDTTPRKRRRRRPNDTSKVSTLRDDVKRIDFQDVLENYPNYHTLSTKTEKAVWLLEYAKANSVDSLSGKEIEFAAHQLSDNIPNAQIAAAMRTPLAKSWVSKTSGGYRILFKGEEMLKAKTIEGSEA